MCVRSLLFFIPVFLNIAFTQDYRFPLNLSPDLSGSFGDLRRNHFHTGLDMRTGGVTGHPVFAIADGWVYRIKVSPYGYGNALYLMHENGYISAYGHLDGFIPVLQDSIFNKQRETQLNHIDWYLKAGAYKVKKGDKIAYAGNSGHSGGPHLHFEIREDEEHILNPMQFYKHLFQDRYAPVPKKIAFTPLEPQALIQGKPYRKEYTLVPKGNGYALSDTVRCSGRVGLEYLVEDRLRAGGFTLNPPLAELYIDDSLHITWQLNRFGFEQKRYVNGHIEYDIFKKNGNQFQRMYRNDRGKMPFYSVNGKHAGEIMLQEGTLHRFTLKISDMHGNATEVKGWLRHQAPAKNTVLPEVSAVKPVITWEQKGNALHLHIRPCDKSTLKGLQAEYADRTVYQLTPVYASATEALVVFPIQKAQTLRISNASETIRKVFLIRAILNPDKIESIAFEGMKVETPLGTLLDTLALHISSSVAVGNSYSPVYTVGDPQVPLMRGIRIGIQASKTVADSNCMYVANCAGGKRTRLDGQEKVGDMYYANSPDFGVFCLVCDQVKPTLGVCNFKSGQNIQGLKHLTFAASDSGAGIDEDKTSVFAGAVWVPAAWDHKLQKFKVDTSLLPKGSFELRIELRDKTGNLHVSRYNLVR